MYNIFAISSDNQEFHGKCTEYHPKTDRLVCEEGMEFYYNAYRLITIRDQNGILLWNLWKMDGERAYFA